MNYLVDSDATATLTSQPGTHCPSQYLKLTINLGNRKTVFGGNTNNYHHPPVLRGARVLLRFIRLL